MKKTEKSKAPKPLNFRDLTVQENPYSLFDRVVTSGIFRAAVTIILICFVALLLFTKIAKADDVSTINGATSTTHFHVHPDGDLFKKVELIRVIDGDTLRVRVTIWPSTVVNTTIRIFGVDTPELRSKCSKTAQLSVAAKHFTEKVLEKGFFLSEVTHGKYAGRYLARVYLPITTSKSSWMSETSLRKYAETGEGPTLSDALIAEGYGLPYYGKGKRPPWDEVFCPQEPITSELSDKFAKVIKRSDSLR
ncbi:MAG: hypothetical protein DRQ35_04980 [Gammaproteobacteria bacterium]|nr:MAG: hypothetical protein DRQ35_04980 [Gammaproteobacteria bacterium]